MRPFCPTYHGQDMTPDWLAHLFATIDGIPSWQLYAIVGVLLVVETTILIGVVTPGEVVLLAAATTVGSAGEYASLAAVAVGASIVGQTGGFLLGRQFGGRIRASWAGRRVGEPNWQRAEHVLRDGRGRVLVGSRFAAVAHAVVPMIAGMLRMPVHRFGWYTVIGAVVWGVVYVGLGSAASAVLRKAAPLLGPAVTAVLLAAIIVGLGFRAVRRRRDRNTRDRNIEGE